MVVDCLFIFDCPLIQNFSLKQFSGETAFYFSLSQNQSHAAQRLRLSKVGAHLQLKIPHRKWF